MKTQVIDQVPAPSVQITSALPTWKINERRVRELVLHMARRLEVNSLEIHVTFVGPAAMRKINSQFRNKDQSTDVLSFPQMEWVTPRLIAQSSTEKKPSKEIARNSQMLRGTKKGLVSFDHEKFLGDIIICLDAAKKNAREDGHDVAREVCFLIAHGILHLCGHDHQKPAEKDLMFKQQETLMNDLVGKWNACVRKVT